MASTDEKKQTHTHNGSSAEGSNPYEGWSEFYQKMANESMDMFQQGMESFQKVNPFHPGGELFQQWFDSYRDFMSRVGEESTTGGVPGDMESYKRLYEAWLDSWTRNLESYMRTPEFAARSGRDLETFSDMRKSMNEAMDAYWHAVRLPSAHDMEELFHKLYVIDRKLDELDRRVRTQAESKTSPAKKS